MLLLTSKNWKWNGNDQLILALKVCWKGHYALLKGNVHTSAEQMQGEAGGKLASTQIITCVHTCPVRSRDGAGAKLAPQEMGLIPNFPRPPQNHTPQTDFCPHRHGWSAQGNPTDNHIYVNIPAVTDWICQNPPVSIAQPLRTWVNIPYLQYHQSCVILPNHIVKFIAIHFNPLRPCDAHMRQ